MADEGSQDDGEKTEEPSQHRIDEFRKRGEVASSKELTNVLILCASIMTLGLSILFIYETLSEFVEWIFTLDVATAYSEKARKTIITNAAMTAFKCVGPIFISSLCIGFLISFMQFGLLFSPEVLSLKPERINPLKGIKRLFSMRSLVEAIKGIFKFIIILSIVYLFMREDLKSYGGFLHMDFFHSFLYGKGMILKLGFAILCGLIVVALGDFAYQKFSYKKKLRQTKEEAKREMKEQEGDPEVKRRIKTIQREMAQKRMMMDIPNADVVVTNPTHLSIVIKYDAENMVSPQVIGKGADHVAMQIRELAKKHNIPLVENVPLARTLYKTVKIGESVPRTMYKAIAEVLAFVYKLKKKAQAISMR